jgi:hypothetical protein
MKNFIIEKLFSIPLFGHGILFLSSMLVVGIVFVCFKQKRAFFILPAAHFLYVSLIEYFWISTPELRDAQGGLIWIGPMVFDFLASMFLGFFKRYFWFWLLIFFNIWNSTIFLVWMVD